MEFAAIADRGPVSQPAACRQLRAVARLPRKVAANPGLSLAQEPYDICFRMGPAGARRRWDGHDEPVGRMDRQPQPTRAGRASKDVRRQWARLPPLERVGRHRGRWCHIAAPGRRPKDAAAAPQARPEAKAAFGFETPAPAAIGSETARSRRARNMNGPALAWP